MKNKLGICLQATIIIVAFALLHNFLLVSRYSRSMSTNKGHRRTTYEYDIRSGKLTEGKDWKTIVFWTPYWGSMDLWKKVFKRQLSGQCEVSQCRLSFNASDVAEADAVLFNGNDLQKRKKSWFELRRSRRAFKHKNRSPNQIYVFFSMEPPPVLANHKLELYDNFFNWTMSYRRDSDVIVPYGKIRRLVKKQSPSKVPYVTQKELQKKKMAVWMSSHCPTHSKREHFVKKLKGYIPVDIYGTCGTLKCGQRTTVPRVERLGEDPCENLIRNYTFYLALENSLCTDYVTEKMYRSLILGVIPVVFGAVNYTEFAPPNSFIDFRDFADFADLAKHMTKVSNNHTLYNQYLKWQEEYEVEIGSPYKPLICDLCKKLHQTSGKRKGQSYDSIKKWYTDKRICYKFNENKTQATGL